MNNLIERIKDYIKDKIEIDNNDKIMLADKPLMYAEKVGALNVLYDIERIISEEEQIDFIAKELEQ